MSKISLKYGNLTARVPAIWSGKWWRQSVKTTKKNIQNALRQAIHATQIPYIILTSMRCIWYYQASVWFSLFVVCDSVLGWAKTAWLWPLQKKAMMHIENKSIDGLTGVIKTLFLGRCVLFPILDGMVDILALQMAKTIFFNKNKKDQNRHYPDIQNLGVGNKANYTHTIRQDPISMTYSLVLSGYYLIMRPFNVIVGPCWMLYASGHGVPAGCAMLLGLVQLFYGICFNKGTQQIVLDTSTSAKQMVNRTAESYLSVSQDAQQKHTNKRALLGRRLSLISECQYHNSLITKLRQVTSSWFSSISDFSWEYLVLPFVVLNAYFLTPQKSFTFGMYHVLSARLWQVVKSIGGLSEYANFITQYYQASKDVSAHSLDYERGKKQPDQALNAMADKCSLQVSGQISKTLKETGDKSTININITVHQKSPDHDQKDGQTQLFRTYNINSMPKCRALLAGGNGKGKSVLLKALNGELPGKIDTHGLKIVKIDQHYEFPTNEDAKMTLPALFVYEWPFGPVNTDESKYAHKADAYAKDKPSTMSLWGRCYKSIQACPKRIQQTVADWPSISSSQSQLKQAEQLMDTYSQVQSVPLGDKQIELSELLTVFSHLFVRLNCLDTFAHTQDAPFSLVDQDSSDTSHHAKTTELTETNRLIPALINKLRTHKWLHNGMSGGQTSIINSLVQLTIAIVAKADILLCDENTSPLDSFAVDQWSRLVSELYNGIYLGSKHKDYKPSFTLLEATHKAMDVSKLMDQYSFFLGVRAISEDSLVVSDQLVDLLKPKARCLDAPRCDVKDDTTQEALRTQEAKQGRSSEVYPHKPGLTMTVS
ncbi:MAG: hypothetical protein VXY77_00650 [Pseudomonadota bacterium]|nr:hypothetical protein [Pseudomonadota bacterium]